MMWRWLARLGSPERFYRLSDSLLPAVSVCCALLIGYGLVGGLVLAPPDYQQGDAYRIIFVHVPAAWMSMFTYVLMATLAFTGTVWRFKLARVLTLSAAPVGASFTFLALATGSIWGKPMWGAWWVWDARLTSELLLLLLYLGFMAMQASIPNPRVAWRVGSILLMVGVVNIPVIHFSVEWWNTLHQPATIAKFGAPSIHPSMLYPLLAMALGYKLLLVVVVMISSQARLIEEGGSWASDLAAGK